MRYLVFLFLYLPVLCFGQVQPLSRNDSALVKRYLSLYQQQLTQNDLKEASRYLNETAFLYWEHNQNEPAIRYYEQSLNLNEQLGNENGVAMIHNNLGMLFSDVRNFKQALFHFDKTLAARRAEKKNTSIIAALINRSVVLNNLEQYDDSAAGLEEALSIARKVNDLQQMRSCYGMLSETYEKAGNTEESLKYFRLYQTFYELMQKDELDKLQTEVEEEKLLKTLAETKSKIKEQELVDRQLQLNSVTQELNEFDSLNRQLFENLSNSQLQLELVKQKAEIDQYKAEEERNRNLAIIEKERSIRNMTLVAAFSLIIVIFFVIRNFLQIKRSQQLIAEKSTQIATQNTKLEELNKIIQKQNERMQSELNVGREIQLGMVPHNFDLSLNNKPFNIFATLEPALEVGGDLYDFFMIDKDHLCFCIGDVSDKGVPAALFMAVSKTLIRANAQYHHDPQNIITQINNEMSLENEASMFVTLFLCVLNLKTGKMKYTNAGHNPPILKRVNGATESLKQLHGPVVGAMEGIDYLQAETQLNRGDQLLLYTDGVTEAMDIESKLFSEARLLELVQRSSTPSPEILIGEIIEAVASFRGQAQQSDDITLLGVEYLT